jgi:hypothetical protein
LSGGDELANGLCASAGAQYQCPPRKITDYGYAEYSFDGIVVSRFLDRGLGDAIIDGYKPDGLLFYQTLMQ